MDNSYIEYLKDFGLTGAEATVYIALLGHGSMTGYEVSKETGISRSNVYSALAGLTDKGAAYVSEGESTRYIPVDMEKFTANSLKELKRKAELLVKNAPKPCEKSEGYITISGTRHIKDKIEDMLLTCEFRAYIMAEKSLMEEIKEQLEALIKSDKKVVLLTDGFKLSGATVYDTKPIPGQIRLITDSSYVLTGSVEGSESDTCLYSGQQNLVDVMKEALKNKILIEGGTVTGELNS